MPAVAGDIPIKASGDTSQPALLAALWAAGQPM